MIEYMYWHSLEIPAKYNDDRLDIFFQFLLSYAILPRLPLHINRLKSIIILCVCSPSTT